MFDVVNLDDGWLRGAPEPSGDERKRWFHAPEESQYSGHWLFKPRTEKLLKLSKARRARGDSPDVLTSGEDWAEKLSFEFAQALDLPAAETELATATPPDESRVWGSMSRDMRPKRWPWSAGASLIAEVDPEFDAHTCVGHTLEAVRDVLTEAKVAGPVGTRYERWPAFDVWAAYMLLDAWIANTDRHAHNWGVVQDPTSGATFLGPSFDHGSALAAVMAESNRTALVDRNAVSRWCANGKSKRFDGGQPRNLVDLAVKGLSLCTPDARAHWVSKIAAVDLAVCDSHISRIPNMSDHTRSFLHTLVITNRKRLCDALH